MTAAGAQTEWAIELHSVQADPFAARYEESRRYAGAFWFARAADLAVVRGPAGIEAERDGNDRSRHLRTGNSTTLAITTPTTNVPTK